MKKRYILIFSVVLSMLLLTACNQGISLTEEEQDKITEYAAGLLLKYDKNYLDMLEEIKEEPIQAVEPDTDTDNPDTTSEAQMSGKDSQLGGADLTEEISATIEEAFQAENLKIFYDGYTLYDVYPERDGDVLALSMKAQQDNKLVILKFNVVNETETEQPFDVLSKNLKCRILVNDSERVNVQVTILMEDLNTYSGVVPAKSAIQTVLIMELPEEQASGLETLDLQVVDQDSTVNIPLQ